MPCGHSGNPERTRRSSREVRSTPVPPSPSSDDELVCFEDDVISVGDARAQRGTLRARVARLLSRVSSIVPDYPREACPDGRLRNRRARCPGTRKRSGHRRTLPPRPAVERWPSRWRRRSWRTPRTRTWMRRLTRRSLAHHPPWITRDRACAARYARGGRDLDRGH